MRLNGLSAPFNGSAPLRASLLALAAALTLSGCLDTSLSQKSETVVQVAEPPPAVVDQTLYAARQDGKFSLPAIDATKIPEQFRRQVVDYQTQLAPSTIVIDPTAKFLYYVLGDGKAMRYGISVGAEGFQWSGESVVARKRQWPTWTPPKEMIARKPSLEKWKDGQPGGPTNPLGARAIYLTTDGVDYGYRIHGTPEWRTIGRNASSGCFRMINQDVLDLYERVQGGERVIVLTKDGKMPTKLSIQTPPKPKTPAPKPEVAPAVPAVVAPEPQGIGVPPALGGAATPAPAVTVPVVPTPVVPAPAPVVTTPNAPVVGTPVVPAVPVTPAPAAPAPAAAAAPASPLTAPPTVNTFAPQAPVTPFVPVAPAPTTAGN